MIKSKTGLTSLILGRALTAVGVLLLVLVTLFSFTRVYTPATVQAADSSTLNFQARLLNSSGNVVPDGNYHIEFKLYDVASGGTAAWTETRTTGNLVRVVNGYFSVNLGSVTALPTTFDWDQEKWLTMNVGGRGGSASFDGEMNPRIKLTAVPYAFTAGELAKSGGGFRSVLRMATPTANRTVTVPNSTASTDTVCLQTLSNCSGTTYSGSDFIVNGITLQTNANFNIQARDSATNGTVGAIIRGAAGGQTVDLLQLQSSAGTNVLVVSAAGGITASGASTFNNTVTVNSGTGVVASFSGRVSGANAVNSNEFVTKAQLDGAGAGSGVTSLNTLTGGLTLQGTTNRITVNSSGSTITLSTPQDIAVTSNVTFGGISITNNATIGGTLAVTGQSTLNNTKVQTTTNSTTGFVISDTNDAPLFTADTINRNININQGSLYVTGLGVPVVNTITVGSNQGGTLSGASSTTYYYRISALNSLGESLASTQQSFPATSFTPLTPPGAPTVAVNITPGNLNGNYTYKITFVTANGQTIGGTTSAVVSPLLGQQVNLTNIPLGPAGTTQRNIYRTLAGGADGTQRFVATLNNNTATTYTDNIADGSLGASLPVSNTARTNTNNLSIAFTTVSGATSYRIYRYTTPNSATGNFQTTSTSPFTDTGAAGTSGTIPTTAAGSIGIGTSSASANLHVAGNALFQNALDSNAALLVQNAAGARILGVNSSAGSIELGQGGSLAGRINLYNTSNSNYVSLRTGTTSATYDLVLPVNAGATGECLKNDATTPGVLVWGSCGGGGSTSTLQDVYNNDADGGDAIIALTTADGAVLIRDTSGQLATSFAVQNSTGTLNYLNVAGSGLSVGVASTFNANVSISGTNTLTVGTGATSLGGTLAVTGAATFSSTVAVNTLGTANSDVVLCRNTTTNQISTCNSTFATASGSANYLARNTNDTSSASFLGNLYGFSNTNTGAAGVLSLTNAGTNSALTVTQSSNPSSGQALIYANNSNASPTGNLIDLRSGGTSQFSVSASGAVTGVSFSGNGSALTSLNASNVSSGTLADARLSTNVTLQGNTFNGASQLVQLNASTQLPAVSGVNLTNLNASNIASGTLADARLSTNVALLNGTQTFSAANTFSAAGTALSVTNSATIGGVLSLTGTLPTSTSDVVLCRNTSNQVSTCNSTFATTTQLNGYLQKNASDTSSASFLGNLYGFTNTNTGAAGVLSLTNSGTSSALTISQSSNPTAGQALIFANNSNASPSGNLVDLRSGGTSRFSVTAGGAVTGVSFSGDGAGLTNLNASNIASGTLADARLSTNVTLQGNTFNGANQLVQLNASTQLPAISGINLTNLNASNIASGTLADARLSTNVALLNASQTFSGNNTFNATSNAVIFSGTPLASSTASVLRFGGAIASGSANGTYIGANPSSFSGDFVNLQVNGTSQYRVSSGGAVTANSFSGNGSALTSLNASNVSSGTLADARLSTNVTLQGNTFNGANQLVQLNASTQLPAVSGVNLTNLNASNIASGTLADARLSTNVALLNGTQTFSGTNTFSAAGTALSVTNNATIGGVLSLTGTLPTSTTDVVLCRNGSNQVSTCNSTFATTTQLNGYLQKNTSDTSSASFLGNLYGFSNTNTGAAGVLSLTNAGTNSALTVTQSGNPASGQALIYANNSNASPSGNLIDLRSGGTSRFSIGANGNATIGGTLAASNFSGSSSGTNTGDVSLAGQNYLSISGQTITANAINLGGTNVTGTLAVSNGGTGATTLTANGILFGNGTSAVQATAAAANSVLVTNGSNVPSLSTSLPNAVQDNITRTGALASGSIASTFGTISTGSNITTTATIQGATVNATSSFTLNGTNINTAGTLNNVAYLNQAQTFSAANTFSAAGTALTVTNNASIGGTLSVTGAVTIGGTLTVNGTNFTNAGSTLFTHSDLANFASGGVIGTAAATVDVKTTFNINQTTAGQVLTMPNPTNLAAGRIVIVSNRGTQAFIMYGVTINPNTSQQFVWIGNGWTPSSIDGAGAGATQVGTVDLFNSANGATISNSTLHLQTATDSRIGLVTFGNQTFGGAKTFNGLVMVNNNLQFSQGTARTLSIVQAASGAGNSLTVAAGQGAASNGAGGVLALQGGAGGGSNQNGGDVLLQGGAATGTGTSGSVIVRSNGTNSPSAFQIQNAASTSIFTADTTNSRVTLAANTGLYFSGNTNAIMRFSSGDSGLLIGNYTASGYTAIQTDRLDIQNTSGGTPLLRIQGGGETTFRNANNSTSALRVLNADATATVFNVDTLNNRIGIGTSTPNAMLDVVGDSTSQVRIRVSNVNANNTAELLAISDSSYGGLVTWGSNSGASAYHNQSGLYVKNGIRFVTDGDVSSGGTSDIRFMIGGYSSSNERMRIDSNGNVAIGNVGSANDRLRVFHQNSITSGTATSGRFELSAVAASNSSARYLAGYNFLGVNPASGTTMSGDIVTSNFNLAQHEGAGTVTRLSGSIGQIGLTSTGGITDASGYRVLSPYATSTGRITTAYGVLIDEQKNSAVTGIGYGIYQGGANDINYFSGLIKSGTLGTPTLSSANLLTTVAEVTTTLRVGDATNGVEFNGTTPPLYRGTARPTKRIMLTAEYAGAVLDPVGGANQGSMTSGFDTVNTTNRMNYYKWTTSLTSAQSYDVVVQVPLPADFNGFASNNPIRINTYTSNTTSGIIQMSFTDSNNSNRLSLVSITPSVTGTWELRDPGAGTISTGTYTAGDYVTLRIRMNSGQGGDTRIGNIYLDYFSRF